MSNTNDYIYGFKFYPDDITEDNIILIKKILKKNYSIEFAMYKDTNITSEQIEKMELSNFDSKKIIYHADYNKFDLTSYFRTNNKERKLNQLIEEIKKAKTLNASKMVLHIERECPIPNKSSNEINYFIKKTIEIFQDLYNKHPDSKNIEILIENTFGELNFYDKLIKELINNKFNVGFTLDIGHAKVWSNNSLKEWIDITLNMINNNVPVHYHIHANKGDFDTHTPLYKVINCEYINKRITGENDFYTNDLIGDIKNLNNILKEKKNVTTTLEVNIKDSVLDYELLTGAKI